MRGLKTLVLALALTAVMAGGARAQNTLYYVDFQTATPDYFLTALANVGAVTTVATDPDNFATLLGGGGFDLAVFFEQDSSGVSYDNAFAALDAFIGGGGAAIADDWTRDAAHAAVFDAVPTGETNLDVVTVTDPALAAGLTNPVALANPTWGVYSYGLTGTSGATFENGDAAIVIGNGGRTLFNGFLSDTVADPADAVTLFENEIRYVTGAQAPVPEPGALTALAAMGVSGLGLIWRRRRA